MTLPAPLSEPTLAPILAALPEARIVGGAVRDGLAGRPVQDIDLATPTLPEETTRALKAAGLRAIPTGLAHGTVTALSGGASYEITTLRRDVETDGRHAVVAFTEDWREDAARRDFTINAMSMDRAGRLHDYFGGEADLAAGRVRFVGETAARIAEDYLRILRFFRFQGRYGRTAPDAETESALTAAAPRLATLSAERLWSETAKILAIADPGPVLALMARLGVLGHLLPEGADPAALARLDEDAPRDPVFRLAALLTDPGTARTVAARLKLSGTERERLLGLLSGEVPAPEAGVATLAQALADTPADLLIGRSALRHPRGPTSQELRRRLAETPAPRFPLQGRDALALGLTPGPALGRMLAEVRGWWLARGCVDDATSCRAELARVAGSAAS